MKHAIGFLVIGALVAVTPASAKPRPVRDCSRGQNLWDVPLVWRVTNDIPRPDVVPLEPGSHAEVAPIRIEIQALTDSRPDPKRIGENREDLRAGCIYPVTTKDDVAGWATDRLRFLVGQLGMTIVDDGGEFVISGELRQFLVTETSNYDGQIAARIDLASKDGKPLWSAIVHGSNGRFGRSYKLANYHETLSDAMLDLAVHLVADPGFMMAIDQKRNKSANE